MIRPDIVARRIGAEGQPVATIDGFHPDPGGLRQAAAKTPFGPARNHYPGIRAALPGDYFHKVRPVLATVLREVFGHVGSVDLIDASFSIVTTPAAALSLVQRLPHVDAVAPERIALVHYLSLDSGDGTAFFRHRSTGFETIDPSRAPVYHQRLDAELRGGHMPPQAYIYGDTPLFERIAGVDAAYNRAAIYRSAILHSGAIGPNATLDDDPAVGRLTVTAFLSAG